MKHQKIYLSRQMTRAMSLDHPIGDPTGGPAYGERNDPVTVVVAGSAMWEGYAAYTAATGFAAFAAGVTAAGGALTLVGAATGNAKLQKLGTTGMILGGLGQIGASLAAESAVTAAPVSEATTAGTTEIAAAGQPVPDVVGPTTGPTPAPTAPAPTPATPTPTAPATGAPSLTAPAPTAPSPTFTGSELGKVDYSIAPTNTINTGSTSLNSASSSLKLPNTTGADKGLLSSAMDFAKTPMGMYTAAQGVGAIANYASGVPEAQKNQLEAQTAYYQSNADKIKLALEQQKQVSANQGTNLGITVNPNAVTVNKPKIT